MTPSVSELRARFEPQMASSLKTFLNKVWELRDEADPDLYKVYVGGRPHAPEDDWTGWDKDLAVGFFDHLEQLALRPSQVQEYGLLPYIAEDPEDFGLDTYGDTMDEWLHLAREAMGKSNPTGELILRDLAKSFFHYRKERVDAAWRVYLHVLPKHRGEVAAHLIKTILPIEGVTNLKVTGPPSKGLDNVVIYHKNESGLEGTLKAVAAYQKVNPQAFGDETVSLARKETEIDAVKVRGVAVAVEPYVHAESLRPARAGWRPSFGDFWEVMLKPILKETRKESKERFMKKVHDTLIKLGMDPMRPEI